MNNIYKNGIRAGNFSSSKIAALLTVGTRPMTEDELKEWKKLNPKSQKKNIDDGFGKPALTYIDEKRLERQLGLLLSAEITSHPFSWGKVGEIMLFEGEEILDSSYERVSQETIQHETIECWVGSPDAKKHTEEGIEAVEAKCPVTRKSYMIAYNCNDITELREKHDEGEEYYWQLVSNAVLLGASKAELIFFMPYQKQLEEIRELCRSSDKIPSNQIYQYMWISNSVDDELPYLKNDERVKNIKIFRFEIPQTDMDLLKEKILAAQKLLEAPEAEVVETKPLPESGQGELKLV